MRRVRGRGFTTLAVAVAAVALLGGVFAGGASGAAVPNLPWTDPLPPLASPTPGEEVEVEHCEEPSIECVRFQIERMEELQERLGCDHRAVFATTYLELTREAERTMVAEPDFMRFPRYFFREDALFANVYFDALEAWEAGERVPPAWRIAFRAAESPHINAGQDMLLGINAHVQNDMPFVLAALGLRDGSGGSIKPDHDKFNQVLNRAYQNVVDEITRRYDPIVGQIAAEWNPLEDLAALEMVRVWRELVWRHAELLVNAPNAATRNLIARQIETNAALWAQALAVPLQRGYGATRDAYCEQQLGG
jgi:hypothetical protein